MLKIKKTIYDLYNEYIWQLCRSVWETNTVIMHSRKAMLCHERSYQMSSLYSDASVHAEATPEREILNNVRKVLCYIWTEQNCVVFCNTMDKMVGPTMWPYGWSHHFVTAWTKWWDQPCDHMNVRDNGYRMLQVYLTIHITSFCSFSFL